MAWKLRYTETAAKQLSKLDKGIQNSIRKYVAECCKLDDPAVRGHGLTGRGPGITATGLVNCASLWRLSAAS